MIAFSSSQQIREAFLRAGPGRELGSAATRRHQSQQAAQELAEQLTEQAVLDPLSTDTPSNTTSQETPITKTTTKLKSPPSLTAGYKEIILLETDFRERFIKGGGNGGQKINKTNSNVELKHFETGIVVQCQATRSLPQNRKLARRILRGQKAEKIREKKKRMARKSAKKYRGAGSEDVGAEDDDDEGGDDDVGVVSGAEQVVKADPMVIPENIIQLTTLEEILAGDNKKPSRRKSSRSS
ncbi:hypothetical protein BGZ95_003675 [Linnemannia exigua]|uniref:Prokaryotic-type class I peptide chain release factors domain-containing protein n=1 Tax=Linnemannia exigua TaxID=604196 RepID=A0AAD4D3Z8_9FUNG|nr:hypothetical protein BGZ95_003675 [Linnemannia exigua]